MKKFLSILLTLAMIFSTMACLGVVSFAADVTEITTAAQLSSLFSSGGNGKLMNDITDKYGYSSSNTLTLDLNGYDLDLNGGHLASYGNVTITNSSDEESSIKNGEWYSVYNSADHNGFVGGLYVAKNASLTLSNITVEGFQSSEYGNITLNEKANLTATSCTFKNNAINSGNGGVIMAETYSTVNLTDCTFTKNIALYGGVAYICTKATFNSTNCTYTENTSNRAGGVFCVGGAYNNNSDKTTINITGGTISKNEATSVGSVFYGGFSSSSGETNVTFDGVEIKDNTSETATLFTTYGDFNTTFKDCTISNNVSSDGYSFSSLDRVTFDGCTVTADSALDTVKFTKNSVIKDSTFVNNGEGASVKCKDYDNGGLIKGDTNIDNLTTTTPVIFDESFSGDVNVYIEEAVSAGYEIAYTNYDYDGLMDNVNFPELSKTYYVDYTFSEGKGIYALKNRLSIKATEDNGFKADVYASDLENAEVDYTWYYAPVTMVPIAPDEEEDELFGMAKVAPFSETTTYDAETNTWTATDGIYFGAIVPCGTDIEVKATPGTVIYAEMFSGEKFMLEDPDNTGVFSFTAVGSEDYGIAYFAVADYNVYSEGTEVETSIQAYMMGYGEGEVVEGQTTDTVDTAGYNDGGFYYVATISYGEGETIELTSNKLSFTHDCVEGDAVKENEVESTCTAKGTYDEVVYCTICDKELSRTAKETEVADHSYTVLLSEKVEPTCTVAGAEALYKCATCEATTGGEEIEATNEHSFTTYVSNNNATCTADGTKTAKCDNCEATETIADEGSKLAHSYTELVSSKVEATCTEDGAEAVYKCATCDATQGGAAIAATGHDYQKDGNTYTCSACGDSYTEEVPATEDDCTYCAKIATETNPLLNFIYKVIDIVYHAYLNFSTLWK